MHTVATAQLLNEQLLKSLFVAHYTSLVRTAFRFLNNLPAAEDLVQEVFCTLWEKRTDLHIESYEGYLRRAVFNRCIFMTYNFNNGGVQLIFITHRSGATFQITYICAFFRNDECVREAGAVRAVQPVESLDRQIDLHATRDMQEGAGADLRG